MCLKFMKTERDFSGFCAAAFLLPPTSRALILIILRAYLEIKKMTKTNWVQIVICAKNIVCEEYKTRT